jgi:hypothetical protein
MDLDTLIREADPSRGFPHADVLSAEAEQTFHSIVEAPGSTRISMRTVQRKRGRIYVVVTLCAALTALGIVVFATNSTVRSSAAAATVLNQAAARAALAPITTPGPGQYFYQETVTLQNCTFLSAAGGGASSEFVYLTPMITQTWTAADGSGIERLAPQGPGHFQTSEQAARFATSGLANGCLQVAQTRPIPPSTPQRPGVANLPSDPQTLASLIAAGRVDDEGRIAPSATACPSGNGNDPQVYVDGEVCSVAAQFDIVNNLLGSPEGPAKLGAVLYQVMAELPGVKIIGSRSDAVGRTGTAIEDPSSGDVLVLDPTTGNLLEKQVLLAAGTAPDPGASLGLPIGTVLNSTTYTSSGVVNGVGMTPQG